MEIARKGSYSITTSAVPRRLRCHKGDWPTFATICTGVRTACATVTIGAGVLTACATVPQYDATTDKNLSALQNEIDVQLVAWISDVQSTDSATKAKSTYANNISFYDKVDSDILALELRMEAVPDASNANLPQYFTNLRGMLDNVKSTQKQDDAATPPVFFDDGVLQQTRWQFAAQFAPLITYELTLKGVASTSKSSTSSSATNIATAKAAAPPTKK